MSKNRSNVTKSKNTGTKATAGKVLVKNGLPLTLTEIIQLADPEQFDAAMRQFWDFAVNNADQGMQQIHLGGVVALEYAERTGNSNGLTYAYHAIKGVKSLQSPAFRTWVETYSPFVYSASKANPGFKKGVTEGFNIEGAKARPYFEKGEQEPKIFTLESLLQAVLNTAKKANGDKINPAQAQAAKEIAAKLEKDVIPMIMAAIDLNPADTNEDTEQVLETNEETADSETTDTLEDVAEAA